MLKLILVILISVLLTSCNSAGITSENGDRDSLSLGKKLYLNSENELCYVWQEGTGPELDTYIGIASVTDDDYVIMTDGRVCDPLSFDGFSDYIELSYLQKNLSREDWVSDKRRDGTLIELDKADTVLKEIEIQYDSDIYFNVSEGIITDYLIIYNNGGNCFDISSETAEKYRSLTENGTLYSGVYSDSKLYIAPAEPFRSWVDTVNEIAKTETVIDVKMHKYNGDGYFNEECPKYVLTESGRLYTVEYGEIVYVEENISDIFFTGKMQTVKITGDHTVSEPCSDSLKGWINIKKIECVDFSKDDYVGLTYDGKILLSENSVIPQETLEWENITDIICVGGDQNYYLIGLKSDGTLVTTSNNSDKHKNIYLSWSGIKEIGYSSSFAAINFDGDILLP